LNIKKFKFFLIALTLALSVNSCVLHNSEPKELNCPVYTQNCNSTPWTGVAIDTAVNSSKFFGYYISIDKVKGLSGGPDEFSYFANKNMNLFTINRDGTQRLQLYKKISFKEFEPSQVINFQDNYHFGSASVNGKNIAFAAQPINDPKKALIVRNKVYYPKDEAIGKSRVYIGTLDKGTIKNYEILHAMDTLDEDRWESQPSFSPNGKVLFFASDRSGGVGGVDIWYCLKEKDGTWSAPINCGRKVNTECDEITPFVDPKGETLYFSSMGHQSVGGYDVFSARIAKGFFSNVEKNMGLLNEDNFNLVTNLRPPLNTPFDEIFPSCFECDSAIYYSSNQLNNNPSDDLILTGFDLFVKYRTNTLKKETYDKVKDLTLDVKLEEPKFKSEIKELILDTIVPKVEPKKEIPQTFELKGKVESPETQKPIPNATITAKYTATNEILATVTSDELGNYVLGLVKGEEFEIVTQGENLFYDSFKIKIDKNDTLTVIQRDLRPPATLTLRINFPYNEYLTPYPTTLDSNGTETDKLWQQELNLLAENIVKDQNSIKKVTIEGHTDEQGGVDYNIKLGQNRAQFVLDELVKRGVEKKLLLAKTAGKTKPLLQRETEDIEIYRKRLRRVIIQKSYK